MLLFVIYLGKIIVIKNMTEKYDWKMYEKGLNLLYYFSFNDRLNNKDGINIVLKEWFCRISKNEMLVNVLLV